MGKQSNASAHYQERLGQIRRQGISAASDEFQWTTRSFCG